MNEKELVGWWMDRLDNEVEDKYLDSPAVEERPSNWDAIEHRIVAAATGR